MSEINSGVYLIRVKGTNHSYVGASTVLDQRMKSSRYEVRRKVRAKLENVQCEILELLPLDESGRNPNSHRVNLLSQIRHREAFWISKLKPSLNKMLKGCIVVGEKSPPQPAELHLASA